MKFCNLSQQILGAESYLKLFENHFSLLKSLQSVDIVPNLLKSTKILRNFNTLNDIINRVVHLRMWGIWEYGGFRRITGNQQESLFSILNIKHKIFKYCYLNKNCFFLNKILLTISATGNFTFKIRSSRVVRNTFNKKIIHDL